jgi:hypothetical protein
MRGNPWFDGSLLGQIEFAGEICGLGFGSFLHGWIGQKWAAERGISRGGRGCNRKLIRRLNRINFAAKSSEEETATASPRGRRSDKWGRAATAGPRLGLELGCYPSRGVEGKPGPAQAERRCWAESCPAAPIPFLLLLFLISDFSFFIYLLISKPKLIQTNFKKKL